MTGTGNDIHLIDKEGGVDTSLTYESLRARAMELLQQYCGDNWTDYNLHDPGITILESICFAITDLAYRTHFPIEDLVTEKDGKVNFRRHAFFPAPLIFSANPVFPDDLRKVVLDNEYSQQEPLLQNIWIAADERQSLLPRVMGVYKIIVQPGINCITGTKNQDTKKTGSIIDEEKKGLLTGRIKKCLQKVRNIGEDFDFEDIKVLVPQEFDISAVINVDRSRFPEELLADIYNTINQFINPSIRFYSESELRTKGKATEEIYNGPTLKNGFITPEDLVKQRCRQIDTEDLVKTITEIKGVGLVKELLVIDKTAGTEKVLKGVYKIADDAFPYFVFKPDSLQIRLKIANEELMPRPAMFSMFLKRYQDWSQHGIPGSSKPAHSNTDVNKAGTTGLINSRGIYRNLTQYFSIQQLLPRIYGLQEPSVRSSFLEEDKEELKPAGHVKQLRAYLLLFDQLMADYLEQLANLGNIFKVMDDKADQVSYFGQSLLSLRLPGASDVIDAQAYKQYLSREQESSYLSVIRKSKAVDHLLSRFNCSPDIYPLELFARFYCNGPNTNMPLIFLRWKAAVLNNIDFITRNRNHGMDYAGEMGLVKPGKHSNVLLGGFEYKMNCLLGIADAAKFGFNKDHFVPNQKRRRLCEVFNSDTLTIRLNSDDTRIAPPGLLAVDKGEYHIEQYESTVAVNSGKEPETRTAPVGKLVFYKSPVTIFKNGLDRDKYRILELKEELTPYWLIYEMQEKNGPQPNTSQKVWRLIEKYADRETAAAGLDLFINQLRDINLRSEGFHLVEHILLHHKNETGYKNFGFSIFDEGGTCFARQQYWMTGEERSSIISKLIKTATITVPPLEEVIKRTQEKYESKLAILQDFQQKLVAGKQLVTGMDETAAAGTKKLPLPDSKSEWEEKKQDTNEVPDILQKEVNSLRNEFEKAKQQYISTVGMELSGVCQITVAMEPAQAYDFFNPYLLVQLFTKYIKDPSDTNTKELLLKLRLPASSKAQETSMVISNHIVRLFGRTLKQFRNNEIKRGRGGAALLQPTIKLLNQKEISEEFLNLRMTVVLPNWTARFQNNQGFRGFVEKMFIDNSPVHMKLHFRWLGISAMQQFEELYFNWLGSLKNQSEDARYFSDELISFLYNENELTGN